MTEEKFNEIKNLYQKIENKKSSIRTIDSLISSCGLSCKISGTPRNLRMTKEYHFSKKEEIIRLLEMEKEVLTSELQELESQFSEH
jgi:predicted transposase YbfD/YdcC